jgi:hypothetical protein
MTDPAYGSPAAWRADRIASTRRWLKLRRRGAAVVELDISETMLSHDRAERPMPVVGDVTALQLGRVRRPNRCGVRQLRWRCGY